MQNIWEKNLPNLQAWEVGPYNFQQGQVQSPPPGLRQSPVSIQAGG